VCVTLKDCGPGMAGRPQVRVTSVHELHHYLQVMLLFIQGH